MYHSIGYSNNPIDTTREGGHSMYNPQPFTPWSAPQQTAPARPTIPNLTYLNQETLAAWREVLSSTIPLYDTNMFMRYSELNTNTFWSALRDLHKSFGRPIITCAETRLELERLSQSARTPSQQQLARKGLEWYMTLLQEGLLKERPAVMEGNGNASSYADAAILDMMFGHKLLGSPDVTYAYIGTDKILANDILTISKLHSFSKGGQIAVTYVNKYGKPVPFDPLASPASPRPEIHATPAANPFRTAQSTAASRRFGPDAEQPWR